MENNVVLYSDVIFHTALDKYTEGVPPIVERCIMFLEYVNNGQCGMFRVLLLCLVPCFQLSPSPPLDSCLLYTSDAADE